MTMAHTTPSNAFQASPSISNLLANRSASPAGTLSVGEIAGITIAGSIIFFLMITPLLIRLAKGQNRDRDHHAAAAAATNPLSNLSFAEHGQLVREISFNVPRRLRKKSTASSEQQRALYLYPMAEEAGGGAEESESGCGTVRRPAKRPPLAVLRGSFTGSNSSRAHSGGGGSSVDDGGEQGQGQGQGYRAPEKVRGYAIYQNRRKTSWIDEDALHGPRVTPKNKSKNKNTSAAAGAGTRRSSSSFWFSGGGLKRTLSRHLSFRAHRAPELARSPTLPYTETNQGFTGVGSSPSRSIDERMQQGNRGTTTTTKSGGGGNEFAETQIDIEAPRPVHRPLQHGRGGHVISPGTQRGPPPPPRAPLPRSQSYNDVAMSAAQQLAGRARVPYLDIGATRQRHSGPPQSNTDAELQAILRRTAERLQDGNRSARRQTLMPQSASSSGRSGQRGGGNQGYRPSNVEQQVCQGDLPPSPTRSQKSAPADLESCDGKTQQTPSSSSSQKNNAPWQTHRRSYSRQISHISQVSMLSEADSLAVLTSKRGSYADGLQTALSSPSRSAQTSPSYTRQVMFERSYTPMSEESSALSTVYSEEEGTPSILRLDDPPTNGRKETGTRDFAEAIMSPKGESAGREQDRTNPNNSPRRYRARTGTLGQALPDGLQARPKSALMRPDGMEKPPARPLPATPTTFILKSPHLTAEDPFAESETPTRATPHRLSAVFSPVPAVPARGTASPSAQMEGEVSGSPTPTVSRRRVVPPPHRLRPGTTSSSPTQHETLPQQQRQQQQIQIQQSPSRATSLTASESGLSSVYESYRYSRCYYSCSDNNSSVSTSQAASTSALERMSPTTTELTAETEETTCTEAEENTEEDVSPATSTQTRPDDDGDKCGGMVMAAAASSIGFRSAHLRLNNAMAGVGAGTGAGAGVYPPHIVVLPVIAPPGIDSTNASNIPIATKPYTAATTSDAQRLRVTQPPQQLLPTREISISGASVFSGSTYSQDQDQDQTQHSDAGQDADAEDEDDQLAPLVPIHASTRRHTMRVTSAVAELRRMNSQLSCVSGYSAATTATGINGSEGGGGGGGEGGMASPTLPALRGGGFSPGKKGAGGGARNYLSLGACLDSNSGTTATATAANSNKGDKGDSSSRGNRGKSSSPSVRRRIADINNAQENSNRGENGKEIPAAAATVPSVVVVSEDRTSPKTERESMSELALQRGGIEIGARRSRYGTVVESFEQDLDRARQMLRQSRGYNNNFHQHTGTMITTTSEASSSSNNGRRHSRLIAQSSE
ncbi:hypothetical protein F4777DRAFT_594662 [Nemania sp. FL0916]|nr:hypothetical protein F4777DRAFT_594662 [Nemania sp. FL0916]